MNSDFDYPTAVLAEYVQSRIGSREAFRVEAWHRYHLLDSIGCAIGACNRPIAKVICEAAPRIERGASIFGSDIRTTPDYAAFANTVFLRYLDFNDTGLGGHPSDMIPAMFAMSEKHGLDARALYLSVDVSYEVVRALRKAGLRLRDKHVDQFQSGIGAACGLATLMSLSEEQTAHAISILVTSGVPLRVVRTGSLSNWKGCATAFASMNAVRIVDWARFGMTGPARPFEGIAGLYQLLGMKPLCFEPVGKRWEGGLSAVQACGYKKYPIEYSAQGPIEMFAQLLPDCDPEEIESIEVWMHHDGWHEIGGGQGDVVEKWQPSSRESADHSLAFLIAVVLLDGVNLMQSLDSDRFLDEDIRAFMERIRIFPSEELTKTHAGEIPKWPSRMKLRFESGQIVERAIASPPGHPFNPMSELELEQKFLSLCEPIIGGRGEQLLKLILTMETAEDLQLLCGSLRLGRN